MNDEQKARVIANCELVLKALKGGQKIQWRERDSLQPIWHDEGSFPSVHPSYEYRLKPEPRTIWVNEYEDEDVAHRSAERARHAGSACDPIRIAVEYREVTK